MMPKILLTGGAGYVGSHTLVSLLENGYDACVLDNMSNSVIVAGKSKPESILRVEGLTGRSCEFVKADLMNISELRSVFENFGPFEAVIHFAAYKAVGESFQSPLKYYRNNVTGSLNLVETMNEFRCKRIVFSSSATVYGDPKYLPIDEKHPTGKTTNPYGQTKLIVEEMIRDLAYSDPEWRAIMLRYFNPVGAHPSGEIGEDPLGPPNNLMPYIAQVSIGRRKVLSVFGNDYDTADGTGVRDYIHVMDLATGHVAALRKLDEPNFSGWKPYNLGTGNGCSVLEVMKAYEKASGKSIPFQIVARRDGDIGTSYASSKLAEKELYWTATKTIEDMCLDTWNWQLKNPNGYQPLQ